MAARFAATLAIAAITLAPLCAAGQAPPTSGPAPQTTTWSSDVSQQFDRSTPSGQATPSAGLTPSDQPRHAAEATPHSPRPIFTRQTLFAIPFSLTPPDSPDNTPVEVHLYVTADRGANWHLYARENPASERFPFRAAADGEFWFATRTVDRLARQRPEGALAPELIVVVDTTPPQLELTATGGTAGEVQAAWRVVDDHLDPESFLLQYQAPLEPSWRPVALNSPRDGVARTNLAGQITWRPETGARVVQVRAEARDTAGNSSVVTRRVFLLQRGSARPESSGGGATAAPPTSPIERGQGQPPQQPEQRGANPWQGAARNADGADNSRGAIPTDPFTTRYGNSPANRYDSSTGSNPNSTPWPADRFSTGQAIDNDPRGGASPTAGPSNQGGGLWNQGGTSDDRRGSALPRDRNVTGPVAPPADLGRNSSFSPPAQGPALESAFGGLGATHSPEGGQNYQPNAEPRTRIAPDDKPRFATALPRFDLAYDVSTTSSISRVELWGTTDGGRTWSRWATDPDRQSPVEVSVDGPGAYGFRVIVENEVGLATRPPAPGELPDVWVVVDRTQPTARILSAPFRVADGSGVLSISWEADDQNLDERPVTLLYAERPSGPWRTLAAALPNTGRYEWRVDPAVPPRLYLRLEVRDAAGNLAVDQLAQPIDIEHMVPSGHIRGVVP